MSAKNFLIKYNYLIRLVNSLFLSLFIPAIIFGFVIISSAYNEVIHRNEDYYRKTTASFYKYFQDQLNMLKYKAVIISDERTAEESRFKKELIESNPYYYINAVNNLANYKVGLPLSSELCLYYKNTDYIISSSYKYAMTDFINIYTGNSRELAPLIKNFFTISDKNMKILSTFNDKSSQSGCLFVGIPIVMYNRYEALVFYILRSDSINTSLFGTQSSGQLEFCVFANDGKLLFTNRQPNPSMLQDKAFHEFLTNKDKSFMNYFDHVKSYALFKVQDYSSKMVFVSIVPHDEIEEGLINFYRTIFNISIFMAIGFIIALVMTVYINYKPILKIVRKIKSPNGNKDVKSEMNIITGTLERMENVVSRQSSMLMDYLLGNLLYANPIRQEEAESMDINLREGSYCVLTISGLKMDSACRARLSELSLIKCNTNIYITDDLYKNCIVIICILKDTSILQSLIQHIKCQLLSQYGLEYHIGVGHTVSQLDDIRKSYLNALSSMDPSPISVQAFDMSSIEGYPTEDIIYFLQYVQNGSEDSAQKSLQKITQYITEKVDTVLLQRYICYDVLTSYIKCIQQIMVPLDKHEIEELLMHANAPDLLNAISISVKHVCNEVSEKNQNIYSMRQKEITDYVNNNFTDPDICRTQVADYFGISVHTLSRVFKDTIGIGFKEYISMKRIEHAKHLLMTTEKSVSEITVETGFDDPNYFSKLFKANYNVSPSNFRKEQK
ncbi:MAG: helix-turn-helix domain-containing protein [Clostridiaceae bacterium]